MGKKLELWASRRPTALASAAALALILVIVFSIVVFQAAPTVKAQAAGSGLVLTGKLNVRAGPGVGYAIIGTVSEGDIVGLISRTADGTWLEISTPTGLVGWVSSAYIQVVVPPIDLPVSGGSEPYGYVNTGALNLRTGPSTAYAVITTLNLGDSVGLLGRNHDGSWAYLRTPSNLFGWASTQYLITSIDVLSLPLADTVTYPPSAPLPGQPIAPPVLPTQPAGPPPLQPSVPGTAIVTTGKLNVRYGPGINYDVITTVDEGTYVLLVGRNLSGTWVKIQLPNGTIGWVNASYVTTVVPPTDLPILSE